MDDELDALTVDSAVAGAEADAAARHEVLVTLISVRRSAGLSQAVVAGRMQTTQSAVSELEGGGTDPYLSTLQRYARAVGARVHVSVGSP